MGRLIGLQSAAGTAHTNTTTEAVAGSFSIPPGGLVLGKAYRWRGALRATSTNSTDTLTVDLKLGPVALTGTDVNVPAAVDAANDDTYVWDLMIVPRTAAGSTSGSVVVGGFAGIVGASGTATGRQQHVVVSSLDLTATQYLAVVPDWSVASASNSCQVEWMSLEEMASEA